MKEDYIDRLLADAGRQGALRRSVAERCDELDGRLAAHAADRRRYYRLALAALATMLMAVGGVNVALGWICAPVLARDGAAGVRGMIRVGRGSADGVIASCRQNTMI